jgi:hypothetical protein
LAAYGAFSLGVGTAATVGGLDWGAGTGIRWKLAVSVKLFSTVIIMLLLFFAGAVTPFHPANV